MPTLRSDIMQATEHRPSPPADDSPYRTCLRCDQPWPCPDRLERVKAEGAEILADHRSDDARRIGVLALVERGVSVWSSTHKDARYDTPLGGVVLEIEDVPDRETGEIERWFTCLDPYGGRPIRVHRIAEKEIGPMGVEPTPNSRLVNLLKRLAAEVAALKGSNLDSHHAQLVRWQNVLVGVITLAA